MKEYIKVEDPQISESRILSYKLLCSNKVGAFFKPNSPALVCEYDRRIDDLDMSILQIPAISSLVTLAWATDADIYTKKLDSKYIESLTKAKSVMHNWYPQLSFGTEIFVQDIGLNRFSGDNYGLLYSGGIDCTASYIKHRNKKLKLVTVSGDGQSIDHHSETVQKNAVSYWHRKGVELLYVKTNLEQVIDQRMFYERFGINWWMNLSHGIVLTGLCAPLTCSEKMATLFIASSFTSKFNYPWGSHPLVDNNIRWADIRVVHDGYEMTRQEKIRYIIKDYIRTTGDFPFLRVCGKYKITGANCRKCEKCSRSIVGLLLEGIDPSRCGFEGTVDTCNLKDDITKAKFFGRKVLAERKVKMINRLYPVYEWEDIRDHIPATINWDIYDSKRFFEWFKNFDIRKSAEKIRIHQLPKLFLYSVFDLLAPVNYLLPKKLRLLNRRSFHFFFQRP